MKKRLTACMLACFMILLVGCSSNTAKEAAKNETKTETSFPAGNTETQSQEETSTEQESVVIQEKTPNTTEKAKIVDESMDECWLDISGTEKIFGSPEKVANEIRETMKFELGLTISVGVSFNKIFAKLGSDMKKPDAVTVIAKDTFREQIWKLPAADLLGVGRATQRVLDSYYIRTIGDLATANRILLSIQNGERLILRLRIAS